MASVFTKIVLGEIPCYKIAETADYLAFLDVRPLVMGHVLVIPKKEVDYLFDLDQELYKGLFVFAQKVAVAIKQTISCKRVGVAVIGLEVPHAHVHLVPLNGMDDINFSRNKLSPSPQELNDIRERISREVRL